MFKNVQKQLYPFILILIFTMVICGVTAATNVTPTNSSNDSNLNATFNATTSETSNVTTKTDIITSKNLTSRIQDKPKDKPISEAESTSIAIPSGESFLGEKSVPHVNGVSSQNGVNPKRVNHGPSHGTIGPITDRRDNSLRQRVYEFDPNFPKPRYRAHHYIDPQNHRMDTCCQTNMQYRYKPRNHKNQKIQSKYHRIDSYQYPMDPKRVQEYNPKIIHPDHHRIDPRYHHKMQHSQHKDPNISREQSKSEQ